eukprot:2000-Rhodomonas_salina.1
MEELSKQQKALEKALRSTKQAQKERKGKEQVGQKKTGGARTYLDDWKDAHEADKAAAAARWRQVEVFCDAEDAAAALLKPVKK